MVLPLTRRQRLVVTVCTLLAVCASLLLLLMTTTQGGSPAGGHRGDSASGNAPAAPGPAPAEAKPAESTPTESMPAASNPAASTSAEASAATPRSGPSGRAPSSKAPSFRDPTSPLVLVNKKHPLTPVDFVPQSLQEIGGGQLLAAPAAEAYARLAAAAAASGAPLVPVSGYRSYDYQSALYSSYAATRGREYADAFSAPPGSSEHQTGLAIDVVGADGACELEACFQDTRAGAWVRENGWRHGFIVRYPLGQREKTGYEYEPWHLRYVGKEAAEAMHRLGLRTFEEYTELKEHGTGGDR